MKTCMGLVSGLVGGVFLLPVAIGFSAAAEEKVELPVKAAPILQLVCPVMGGKINPELYVDVDGRRVYVCCAGCTAAILKEPAKYIAKVDEHISARQQTCPVMEGNKVDRKLFVAHQGRKIYVCCRGCLPKVEADPAGYLKKVDAQIAAQGQEKTGAVKGK